MWNDQYMTLQILGISSNSANLQQQGDAFHMHKLPAGDTPYVKAKHVQLVEKDPLKAIALFWAAINAGDRVDSALKDMALVMKQQNRPEEAIQAIISLRDRCSDHAQEALDNVLLDLYKRCGKLDEQISLLKHKLHLIHQGLAFNGKRTKTARSQGKKFQVSIEQEASRLLGNLGWAYMQQAKYNAAEAVYRKALSIEPDNNKVCNLGICQMKQGKLEEAKLTLESVSCENPDSYWSTNSWKAYERAQEMLRELEVIGVGNREETYNTGSPVRWTPFSSRLFIRDTLAATSGFGPVSPTTQQIINSDKADITSCDTDDEEYSRSNSLRNIRQRIRSPEIFHVTEEGDDDDDDDDDDYDDDDASGVGNDFKKSSRVVRRSIVFDALSGDSLQQHRRLKVFKEITTTTSIVP